MACHIGGTAIVTKGPSRTEVVREEDSSGRALVRSFVDTDFFVCLALLLRYPQILS